MSPAEVLAFTHRDRDAVAIGDLYRKASASFIDSARYYLQCGHQLTAKKQELGHGHWLPWLQANADVLGFDERNAQKLMKVVIKYGVNAVFDETQAADFSRELWGNDATNWNQSGSNAYFTPPKYIAAARQVLGGIDLDPASEADANRTVKARRFYSQEDDGLTQPWRGRIWLNSPYSKLVGQFIAKLLSQYAEGHVTAAIALVSAHATDTEWFQPLLDHRLCFTNHRIHFYSGKASSYGPGIGGSIFAYLGPHPDSFEQHFAQFGRVVGTRCAWGMP